MNPEQEWSTPAVWGLAMSVVLWVVALFFSAVLVLAIAAPETTCETRIPPFEGLSVERAERSWAPPFVRCTFRDHDPGQEELVSMDAFETGDVLFVVILDLAAVAEAIRRVRKRRRPAPTPVASHR